MVRSKAGPLGNKVDSLSFDERLTWRQNKKKMKFEYDQHPTSMGKVFGPRIPVVAPETECEHCKATAKNDDDDDDLFNEYGYPLPKAVIQAGKIARERGPPLVLAAPPTNNGYFRFLDLPPEIRIQIYEMVMHRAKQPVCIPDRLLRPSEDIPDPANVLRECSAETICLPCQLHDLLGTSHPGLSRASKQLHSETALIPYKVNTFSLHNLYYLQTFLRLVGGKGRQSLKSLQFVWKLPEEDAHALGAYTSVRDTYMLLCECCSLTELSVELDVVNMLTWRGNGKPRSAMLKLIKELPCLELVYELRGPKEIKIGWKHCKGLQGMETWAKELAGHWRLPHGANQAMAKPVESDVVVSKDRVWHYIHWQAHSEKTGFEGRSEQTRR